MKTCLVVFHCSHPFEPYRFCSPLRSVCYGDFFCCWSCCWYYCTYYRYYHYCFCICYYSVISHTFTLFISFLSYWYTEIYWFNFFSPWDDTEEAPVEKEKPNFEPSGKLAEDTNTYRGVVIKYNEPDDAQIPKTYWRLYPFKVGFMIYTS